MEFKIGDTVTVKERCSGCIPGKIYILKYEDNYGCKKEDLWATGGEKGSCGCKCKQKWIRIGEEKLKTGDRVKISNNAINNCTEEPHVGRGSEGIIENPNYRGNGLATIKLTNGCCYDPKYVIKIGEAMSPRQRIEALKNGWDKEADDILQEIHVEEKFSHVYVGDVWYSHLINLHIKVSGKLKKGENFEKLFSFSRNSQCEKNQAFKNALLWLLDKSGLEVDKEKEDKISKLREKIQDIEKELTALEKA